MGNSVLTWLTTHTEGQHHSFESSASFYRSAALAHTIPYWFWNWYVNKPVVTDDCVALFICGVSVMSSDSTQSFPNYFNLLFYRQPFKPFTQFSRVNK